MVKVFFDSSVIVAAAGSQGGGSFKIVNFVKDGIVEGWISEGVVAESEEAIRTKLSQEKFELFLLWLESDFFKITPFPEENKLQKFKEIDVKDRHILISAEEAKVEFLISLDKNHILTQESQKAIPKIKIVSPGDFLQKYFK